MNLNRPHFSILAVLVSLTGCSGRNVHKELTPDTHVMVRKWTLSTHTQFEAGDKGFEYSNPILLDNTLIFGNHTTGLTSMYPGLVQTRWTLPIRGGVVSEIAVDKGDIYFGGGDGFLYSVNSENGHVNWRYELKNPRLANGYGIIAGARVRWQPSWEPQVPWSMAMRF